MVARRTPARREYIKKALKQRFITVEGMKFYYLEVPNNKITTTVVVFGVKKAVDRNRIKRVVKEALWDVIENQKPPIFKGVIVIVVNNQLKKATFITVHALIVELVGIFYKKIDKS